MPYAPYREIRAPVARASAGCAGSSFLIGSVDDAVKGVCAVSLGDESWVFDRFGRHQVSGGTRRSSRASAFNVCLSVVAFADESAKRGRRQTINRQQIWMLVGTH